METVLVKMVILEVLLMTVVDLVDFIVVGVYGVVMEEVVMAVVGGGSGCGRGSINKLPGGAEAKWKPN